MTMLQFASYTLPVSHLLARARETTKTPRIIGRKVIVCIFLSCFLSLIENHRIQLLMLLSNSILGRRFAKEKADTARVVSRHVASRMSRYLTRQDRNNRIAFECRALILASGISRIPRYAATHREFIPHVASHTAILSR